MPFLGGGKVHYLCFVEKSGSSTRFRIVSANGIRWERHGSNFSLPIFVIIIRSLLLLRNGTFLQEKYEKRRKIVASHRLEGSNNTVP